MTRRAGKSLISPGGWRFVLPARPGPVRVAEVCIHHAEVPHPQSVLNSTLELIADIIGRPQGRSDAGISRDIINEARRLVPKATVRLNNERDELSALRLSTRSVLTIFPPLRPLLLPVPFASWR